MSNLSEQLNNMSLEKRLYILEALPTHLAGAEQLERLHEILSSFEFMETKAVVLGPQPLIDDYDLSDEDTLRLIQRALRQEAHVLAEHPDLLWQQLYNRLQWEDPVPQMLAAEKARRSLAGARPWLRLRHPVPESVTLVRTLTHHASVNACTFSPDGATIVSGGENQTLNALDYTLKLWDVQTGQELAIFIGHTNRVTSCAFSPDGSTILSGSDDQKLKLWDVQTRQELATLTGHTEAVTCCAFSPDGSMIASGSADRTLKLWDVQTRQELATLTGHTEAVTCCAFSPDGSTVLSGSLDGTLKLWNVCTGQERMIFKDYIDYILQANPTAPILRYDTTGRRHITAGHVLRIFACTFSPNGATILSAGDGTTEHTLLLWDAQTGEEYTASRYGHRETVRACAFSRDGNIILSGSADRTLKLWNVQTGQELATLTGHTGAVTSCAFSPDGSTVLSGSLDGTLKLWDVQMRLKGSNSHTEHVGSIWTCAFSPDGTIIASGGYDRTLKLWNAQTGVAFGTLRGHEETVRTCAFSPDGTTLISGSQDYTLKRWDIQDEWPLKMPRLKYLDLHPTQERATLKGHADWVTSCAFSLDGTTFVSGCDDGTLILWDAHNWKEKVSWRGHMGWGGRYNGVLACAFSLDGTTILSGGADGTLKLWDAYTGQQRTTLRGHTGPIWACVFSPDGKTIVSAGGSGDHTLKLWDVRTEQEPVTLHGHTDIVTDCAFSPDGTTIISVSLDNTLKLWDATTGQELAILPLPGGPLCLAAHTWQPYIVVGTEGGNLYRVDLIGIAGGSPIVTAEHRRDGSVVRCPRCRHVIVLDKSQLGHEITCPQPECAMCLRINPSVIRPPAPQKYLYFLAAIVVGGIVSGLTGSIVPGIAITLLVIVILTLRRILPDKVDQ